MDNELLVKSIKNICRINNISVSQLENTLGFSPSLISRWNKTSPSLDKIIDIADYFHVSLDEVVGRNQKKKNKNYNFISLIIEQTKNNILQWKDYFSLDFSKIKCKKPEDINSILSNFNNYYDREMYTFFAEYNNGYLILSCYLVVPNNAIEKYEFFFYVQPNNDTQPVYQLCDQEQLLELYRCIRKSLYGETPELLAEDFKQQFIIEQEKSMLNGINQYLKNVPENNEDLDKFIVDENAKKILTEVNSPEVQQLIAMFTDPKMVQAMESAKKLIQYFGDIKEAKDKNNEQ